MSRLIAVIGLLLLLPSMVLAQEMTLQGQVEQYAQIRGNQMQGEVLDHDTGKPLAGAHVTLPDSGYQMSTDPKGMYQVPRPMGQQPLIMSIEKPGYAPLSITIQEDAPPRFTIRLQKQERILVLDNRLHHLGDGGYSEYSSNATSFRKPADGPMVQLSFQLDLDNAGKAPYLQIGSIIGLDTAMDHFLRKSLMPVSAGPLLIRLNRQVIAQVQVNGDNQKIQVPRNLLNPKGPNFLEIEAGSHFPEPGRLDYDDMELMHIVLHY